MNFNPANPASTNPLNVMAREAMFDSDRKSKSTTETAEVVEQPKPLPQDYEKPEVGVGIYILAALILGFGITLIIAAIRLK